MPYTRKKGFYFFILLIILILSWISFASIQPVSTKNLVSNQLNEGNSSSTSINLSKQKDSIRAVKASVTILSQNSNSLRIRFQYPDPIIDSTNSLTSIIISGLSNERIDAGFFLPLDVRQFVWLNGSPTLRVVSIETKQKYVSNLLAVPSIIGDSVINESIHPSNGFVPNSFVNVQEIGKYRGIPLASIVVHPVRYNAQELRMIYIQELIVEISSANTPSILNGRPLQPYERESLLQITGDLSATIPISLTTGLVPTPTLDNLIDNGYAIRLDVKETGLYRVTGAELANLGVPISELQPSTILMRSEGQTIPIHIEGDEDGRIDPQDAIEFFGRPPLPEDTLGSPELSGNTYTIEKAYLLTWNNNRGLRIPHVSGEIRITNPLDTNLVVVPSGPSRIHFEQNSFFGGLSDVQKFVADRYFWDAGIYNHEIRDYNFHLPHPDTSSFTPVKIKVALQGLTGGFTYHHAYVLVNGSSDYSLDIGRTSQGVFNWVGQTPKIGESTSSSQLFNRNFRHGNNILSIFSPGDAPNANATNRISLNWFQIEYLRFPAADNNEILIGTPLTNNIIHRYFDYTLENFTSPDIHVFRWGTAKVINGTVERYVNRDNQIRYKVHFQDSPSQPTEYFAITSDRKKSFLPEQIALIAPDSILSPPSGGAEFIIIGSSDLLASSTLQSLIALRSTQFQGVMKVDVEAVLRRFSNGMFHPNGIKNFLKYAVSNWTIPPRYVLLLGDGLQRQHRTPRRNGAIIPHPMIPVTQIGVVGSDTWYSLLDDENDLPDIHVSRVPSRTQEEVDNYFNKVLELENSPTIERWQNYITFITGSGGENIYSIYNRIVRNRLSPHQDFWEMQVENPSRPYYGSTTLLQNLFEKGSSLVIYNGHGAGEIWSDGGLFRTRDINNMRNAGKYPLICNFSCFIVAFNGDVQRSSMGEDFVLNPNRGAVGVFGTAGLGYREQMILFQQYMFEQLQNHPNISYGELMTNTKLIYLSRYGGRATFGPVGNTFFATSLLGDPTFQFQPIQTVEQNSNQVFIQVGDSVDVSTTLPFSTGSASFVWYNEQHFSIDSPVWQPIETLKPITNSSVSVRLAVPSGLSGNQVTLRAFYRNPSGPSVRSASRFFVQSSAINGFVDSVLTNPNPLLSDSSYKFLAKVIDSDGIRSVRGIIRVYDEIDSLVRTDTVNLNSSVSNGQFWYESGLQPPISPTWRLRTNWSWTDSIGVTRQSPQQYDFFAFSRSPNLIVGNQVSWRAVDTLYVKAIITNNSFVTTPPSVVRLIVLNQSSDTVSVEFVPISGVPPLTPLSVYIPFKYPPGNYQFYITADYNNDIAESNENDNTIYLASNNNYWWLTSEHGDNGFPFTPTPKFKVSVPVGSIQRASTVLSVTLSDTLESRLQTSLRFASFGRSTSSLLNGKGFVFTRIDTSAMLQRIIVEIQADTIVGNRTQIHGRNQSNLWRMLNSTADIQGIHRYDGVFYHQFALLDNQDRTPPRFDFTAEGQIFSDGGYIRSGARLSANVYDIGGLDFSVPGTVIAVVNGDTIPSNEIMYSTQTSQVSPIVLSRRFPSGRHWAKLIVTDMSNNSSSDSINFLVANQFVMEWFGNFPNPFQKTTTFFYSLTDQTTEPVEISIYTVSGKKIRTIRETDSQVINYREITWDGRDENGEAVANGVYFYRLKAKNGGQIIEKKGKLAKLR